MNQNQDILGRIRQKAERCPGVLGVFFLLLLFFFPRRRHGSHHGPILLLQHPLRRRGRSAAPGGRFLLPAAGSSPTPEPSRPVPCLWLSMRLPRRLSGAVNELLVRNVGGGDGEMSSALQALRSPCRRSALSLRIPRSPGTPSSWGHRALPVARIWLLGMRVRAEIPSSFICPEDIELGMLRQAPSPCRGRAAAGTKRGRSDSGAEPRGFSASFGAEQDVSLPASCQPRAREPWQAPAEPAGLKSCALSAGDPWRGPHGVWFPQQQLAEVASGGMFGARVIPKQQQGHAERGAGGCRAGPWGWALRLGSC